MSKNGLAEGTYGTLYYVKDMTKSVAFYKDYLKLKPTYESPEWTEFSINGHALCFHDLGRNDKNVTPNGTLIIRVNKIKELVPQLQKKGMEFLKEIQEVHPGAYCADFRDPSGNVMSLYEDTNVR